MKTTFTPRFADDSGKPFAAETVSILGLSLVLHRTPDPQTGLETKWHRWSVSDPDSRMRIVQHCASKAQAIAAAEARILQVGGVETFHKAVTAWKAKHAASEVQS
jgi:rhodanese-related sulfurtransferase